jgi:hypothetical protein
MLHAGLDLSPQASGYCLPAEDGERIEVVPRLKGAINRVAT